MEIQKILVILIGFGFITTLFFVLNYEDYIQLSFFMANEDCRFSCWEKPSNDNSFPTLDVQQEKSRLLSGRNIFFHETSCSETNLTELNCRQACAVESAALTNPTMTVNLLFLNSAPPSNTTQRLINILLHHYKNVVVNRIEIAKYVENTPAEEWYKSGILLKTSAYPKIHMADFIRFLTLWKFGGIYFDLDVIVMKSLEDLSNFSAAQDEKNVAIGAFGFGLNSLGRYVANQCLRDLINNFDGKEWAYNGVGVLTRTLQQLCRTINPLEMTSERCIGFSVYDPALFYPLYYEDWRLYFDEEQADETMNIIENAWVIHVWNKFSYNQPLHYGSRAPYALVAQKYCPKIYESCPIF